MEKGGGSRGAFQEGGKQSVSPAYAHLDPLIIGTESEKRQHIRWSVKELGMRLGDSTGGIEGDLKISAVILLLPEFTGCLMDLESEIKQGVREEVRG